MRRYHIISGILLILPIIGFAGSAPVLPAGVEHMPEDVKTMLELDGSFTWIEDHFSKPEESPSAQPSRPKHSSTYVGKPLSPIPEESSPVSSPDHELPNSESLTGSGYELVEGDAQPRPSSPAWSTVPDAESELVDANTLPNPGLSTVSDHMLTGMDAPLLSPVYPIWSYLDHELMKAHSPSLKSGSSNPRPSTEFDSDHRLVAGEPPSGPASPTESDVDHKPRGGASTAAGLSIADRIRR